MFAEPHRRQTNGTADVSVTNASPTDGHSSKSLLQNDSIKKLGLPVAATVLAITLLIALKMACCKRRKKIGWAGTVFDDDTSQSNLFDGMDVMRCDIGRTCCACFCGRSNCTKNLLSLPMRFRASGLTEGMMLESNPIAVGSRLQAQEPSGPPPGTHPHGLGGEPNRPPPFNPTLRAGGNRESLLHTQHLLDTQL
eukprot:SAG31_NODE_3592_length_4090_cov_29.997745_2_plen_195_part_00